MVRGFANILVLTMITFAGCETSHYKSQAQTESGTGVSTTSGQCSYQPERCDGIDNDCDGAVDESSLGQPFHIQNLADFGTIAKCNYGAFRLNNNLTLPENYSFPGNPIPNFYGNLHGNGYTLFLKTRWSPLFNYIGSSAAILYLNLELPWTPYPQSIRLEQPVAGVFAKENWGWMREMNLKKLTVYAAAQSIQDVGGLVGRNYGKIEYIRGDIFLPTHNFEAYHKNVGGVAGQNFGLLHAIYLDTKTSKNRNSGGVAGVNGGVGEIRNCRITGGIGQQPYQGYNVEIPYYSSGGISGTNWGRIEHCTSLANVDNTTFGGIAGVNATDAVVIDSYATNVLFPNYMQAHFDNGNSGGIVGENYGKVIRTYFQKPVSNSQVDLDGHIVGTNTAIGKVWDSFYQQGTTLKPGCKVNWGVCYAYSRTDAELRSPATYLSFLWPQSIWKLVQGSYAQFHWD